MKDSVSQPRKPRNDGKRAQNDGQGTPVRRTFADYLYAELVLSVARNGQTPREFRLPMPGRLFEDWRYRAQTGMSEQIRRVVILISAFLRNPLMQVEFLDGGTVRYTCLERRGERLMRVTITEYPRG